MYHNAAEDGYRRLTPGLRRAAGGLLCRRIRVRFAGGGWQTTFVACLQVDLLVVWLTIFPAPIEDALPLEGERTSGRMV